MTMLLHKFGLKIPRRYGNSKFLTLMLIILKGLSCVRGQPFKLFKIGIGALFL